MKELQAALQSRIDKRSAQITALEVIIAAAKLCKAHALVRQYNKELKDLVEHQVVDKTIMRNVYWSRT